jgi:hypothetical protein
MQGHGLRGATRQHESSAFAFGWTDRPEEVGGCGALIAWGYGTGAALRPAAADRVLLANAGLVTEPDLERPAMCLIGRNFLQACGEVVLKRRAASSFRAW